MDSQATAVTPIADDERFKGGIHGLLLGCVLPVFVFNVVRRNAFNTLAYGALIGFEMWHIAGHLRAAKEQR